ncbi:MAG: transcriptional regulator NrdR [Planctomycetes bacterium]|nr:transcriptional regulator NrdR [Planctomycetota bacterium]
MRCPFCENPKTRVVDSRELNEGFTVRRRRICQDCETRFTTYESLKIHEMKVLKRNKKYEPFDKEKIVGSIKRACIKLPIKAEEIEEIIREVEGRIWRNTSREINSRDIGKIILNHLKKVHPLAFLRFASVFFEYASLDELIKNTLDLKREIDDTTKSTEDSEKISEEQTAKQVITEELIDDLSRKLLDSGVESVLADDAEDAEILDAKKVDKTAEEKTESQKDKQKPSTLFD